MVSLLHKEVSKQDSVLEGEKRKGISIFTTVLREHFRGIFNRIRLAHMGILKNENYFHLKLKICCFLKVIGKVFVKRTIG